MSSFVGAFPPPSSPASHIPNVQRLADRTLPNVPIFAILAEMEVIMATVTLSASEFQDRVGEALDRSLSQPVLITKHGRPRNVVLSYDEYERLRARDRRVVRAEDLTDEDIAAIEASEMAPGYEHLNAELKEQ
jgi:prevent-host-death family protein